MMMTNMNTITGVEVQDLAKCLMLLINQAGFAMML
jgi:hypothetical protein